MSYRKIVTVINEHVSSTFTASYAISLAAETNAELELYAAHEALRSETVHTQTNRHLDTVFSVASERHIPLSRSYETGNLSMLLPKRVQEEKADLVFYPLSPEEEYGTALQQNTVHHLLRRVSADLAIMRTISMPKQDKGNILVPMGKVVSDKTRRLQFIVELSRSFHARVTLFHMFVEHEVRGTPIGINEFRQQLALQNVAVTMRCGRGALAQAIAVEARTQQNDLILLGASGRGLLRTLYYGNLAGDLLHTPPCNTILFRAAP